MTQSEKVLYTGKVRTVGGRDGASRSADGRLDVKLSTPGSPVAAPIRSSSSRRAGRPASKGRSIWRPGR